ncbi:histidine--tRNA ligase [candidate division WOR-1 bacterium RIFOXYB2_FULL_48_7]|uniref:Histidine--tRNA ligase n=1 Tax=candidate division WOR-1 bacterium RIFOXYB2_FULL_48_7 TaxID=1802583 RepID=A0A1F4TLK7_UNCSA|nr:MAG: histidine--tRNA ligase [candidate division WOR-1 bacterium RIFOXYB2_FULL_48_7]
MKYGIPRGTKDILPAEAKLWQLVEQACREIFALYDYSEIRTPIFEFTDLFTRSIGSGTDIVKKEMYTFADRKGRSLTLRPEATAAVVRAGIENNLISIESLAKLYYLGPMFRYERPQAGRQRQFHQAGVEVFGSADPRLDAEVIELSVRLFEKVGLKDLVVNLNSVGCPKCQPEFRGAIKKHFAQHISDMCQDCRDRLEQNPMRILDCKEAHCQKYLEKAPASLDYLCPECKNHFDQVVGWLGNLGIKYQVNDRLVRGLDYYTKTAFEVIARQLGAQNAVCGGGRYDNLVAELGGKATPAIGFAIGLERVISLITDHQLPITNEGNIKLFIATLGEAATKQGFALLSQARALGISADMDFLGKSLKAQLKNADRLKAAFVYVMGDEEVKKGSAGLKNMATGEQSEVEFSQLITRLK